MAKVDSDKTGFIIKLIGYVVLGVLLIGAVLGFFSLTSWSESDFSSSYKFVLSLLAAWWSAVSGNKVISSLVWVLVGITVIRALFALFLGVVIPAGDFIYRRGDAEFNKAYDAAPRSVRKLMDNWKEGRKDRKEKRESRKEKLWDQATIRRMTRQQNRGANRKISRSARSGLRHSRAVERKMRREAKRGSLQ